MKKIIVCILGFVMLLGAFAFAGCSGENNTEGYVCIDINPSVELVINRNDKVVTANALNVDAEIVLSGINLIGMDMTDAVKLFVQTATELGYIDVDAGEDDPNAVLVTTIAFTGRRARAIKAKMLNCIDNYFMENGIWGIAWSDEDLGTMIEEAEELGISAGKYRLIKAVQISYPEKTVEELQNMSIRGLIDLIKEKSPVDTLVNNYTLRKEYLESLESLTENEQTELDEINAKLDNIEQLKAKVAADKEALKERAKDRYNEFCENKTDRCNQRRGRWQQFKNKYPKMAQRIADKFSENFCGR